MSKIMHITRDDIILSLVSPIDNIVPEFIGQQCIRTNGEIYFANGLTSLDWIMPGSNFENSINDLISRMGVLEDKVAAVGDLKALTSAMIQQYNEKVDLLTNR